MIAVLAPNGMCGMCDVTRYQVDTKGLLFSSICVNIVLFSTHRAVMTSDDVREECLECHMTSNDVGEECSIIVMMGSCVNKPDQTEPVGFYQNTFISKIAKCV